LRLMAIRQARLEPPALTASGHERMVNGWAAASGEEKFDLPAGIARFGDILNEGPLVEIGSHSVFDTLTVGGGWWMAVASGGGSAHDLTPLATAGAGVGRKHSG